MTRTRIALAVCAAVALSTMPVVTSSAAGLKFHAKLSGAQEVPSKGDPDGGATVTLEQITAKPGSFYVNLHTKKYPSGAVRGQIFSTTNP